MAQNEIFVNLTPAPFVPSISFTGTEPGFLIRGQNLWLRSNSETLIYAVAYKGSKDLNEPIPTKTLSGTIAWASGSDLITGTLTQFLTELRIGQFVIADTSPTSQFFVIEEVISDVSARVSRFFDTTQLGKTAYVLPILYASGIKRATQIRGNTARFPRGHYLGVGDGEFKLNGQSFAIRQVEVLTVIGTITTAGNATVTVTAASLTGSPVVLSVAVALNDTAAQVAAKVRIALAGDANVSAFASAFAFGNKVGLAKLAPAANDTTFNIAITNGTCAGLTPVTSSANTVSGNQFLLSKLPRYLMFDEAANNYEQVDFGITLPTDIPGTNPIITLSVSPVNGVKNMPSATFGVRVVAKSDENAGSMTGATTGGTGGFSQPSANYTIATGAVNKQIRVTFNQAMNVIEGQNAWDIYVTKFEDATSAALNNQKGPWFYYETVTSVQLGGSGAGTFRDIEFADGELGALDKLLSFDNFAPYDAEFCDLITSEAGITPIFFSCLGKKLPARREGTSPGPSVVVGKADNPEAILRNASVSTYDGDTIIGLNNDRGRFWLTCENSLQTAILTGLPRAPVTCRSYWTIGFRNPYNIKFLKDYIFGFSTSGFIRSIGVGDTSEIDFVFSTPIDEFVTDWICSHVLTAYDPKNKAVCFFFSGKEKQSNHWVTMVLPFLPHQNIWNPPILLKKVNADFVVSGVATVGQALYFVAGGRTSGGAIEARTYEFDAADGIVLDCYLTWAFSDLGKEDNPQDIKGVASVLGNGNPMTVEIIGLEPDGSINFAALENGTGDPLRTIIMTGSGFRKREKRQHVPARSKWTVRLSFQSTNGSGRIDEVNILVGSNASRA